MMLIGLGGGTGAGKSAIVQSLVGRIGGYAGWVRPARERYVEPTRAYADDVVANDGPLEDAVEQVLALVRRRRVDGLAGAGRPLGR